MPIASQTRTASVIISSRCSLGDDGVEHGSRALILGRSSLPLGAEADDARLHVNFDFLDQQRLAIEQRDREFAAVDELLRRARARGTRREAAAGA